MIHLSSEASQGIRASAEETSFANLDEDEQLLAVFRLAVWICRRPASVLSKADKAALLVHAINNMNSLMKTTKSVSSLA